MPIEMALIKKGVGSESGIYIFVCYPLLLLFEKVRL